MEAARRAIPDLDDQVAAGRFDDLLGWLRKEIHAFGRTLESEPLVEQATGGSVSGDWLVRSLRDRYGPAYGL
jgi:carboxypeptidase Taq